ncbi:MAG TPA: AmmeMemoRadiSam system protein B [Desulfosalsimonadaceae bacterium]|nr:AmmeMemoRadiSam system protein B [Desulfosalsimonadaceae bacterium]
MKINLLIVNIFIVLSLFAFFSAEPLHAGGIREAVFAGKFYPADSEQLHQQIQELLEEARKTDIQTPAKKKLKALVMPHAGYVYSGRTAAHAARTLTGANFSKAIILGPDHRVGFQNGAISNAKAYKTPLGRIDLHPDAAKLRNSFDCFRHVLASDQKEHSIEVILPFLQTQLNGFQLIPIVLGPGNIKQYAEAINSIYADTSLLVVSTDLSHYLSYAKANRRDRQTINMILNLNGKNLADGSNRACGVTPLRVLIDLAKQHKWKPVLLFHENSADTAGSRQQVVGYAAIAFYGEESMTQSNEMSEEKGQQLVQLARQTIAKRLGVEPDEAADVESRLSDDIFQSRRGTFVTLTKNDQLRGCIGNLLPDKPLKEGVKDNAMNAAFNDPRFPALSKDELDQIVIEVSLLTEPQPLEYKDAEDLLAKLRLHVDGVILRKGMYSSTFLPQVWEQLPDKEMFLSHLCLKAGLPGNEWKKGDLEVLTYQVQYFEERK